MEKKNIKQVIVSIVIGACVAFFSTLFSELATLLKTHSTEIVSAMAASGTYLAKAYKG